MNLFLDGQVRIFSLYENGLSDQCVTCVLAIVCKSFKKTGPMGESDRSDRPDWVKPDRFISFAGFWCVVGTHLAVAGCYKAVTRQQNSHRKASHHSTKRKSIQSNVDLVDFVDLVDLITHMRLGKIIL